MNRLKKLTLAALVALTIATGAAGAIGAAATDETLARKVNEYEGQHRVAGDPSQWGKAAKVNEYEGQHRVAISLNFTKIEV